MRHCNMPIPHHPPETTSTKRTGGTGGFNLIGKIQPDQKGLNLPDQVYTSPQQAFSRMRKHA